MGTNYAAVDPALVADDRVLENLLNTEKLTMLSYDYFAEFQTGIQPYMRKVVTTWMLEVCDEQRCEDQSFPLAVNYMDRFLSLCPISKTQFQLLGAVCLLLATKVRQCQSLTTDLLSAYTQCSVSIDEIRNWELFVLATLEWNLSAVTGYDFVDHILERVPWGKDNKHIRQHTLTLVSVCQTETDFFFTTPSVLACACICAATRGINSPLANRVLRDTCMLTGCDPLDVEITVRNIEKVVAEETAVLQKESNSKIQQYAISAKKPTGMDYDGTEQPETPTDVQNIYL